MSKAAGAVPCRRRADPDIRAIRTSHRQQQLTGLAFLAELLDIHKYDSLMRPKGGMSPSWCPASFWHPTSRPIVATLAEPQAKLMWDSQVGGVIRAFSNRRMSLEARGQAARDNSFPSLNFE